MIRALREAAALIDQIVREEIDEPREAARQTETQEERR